MFFTESITVYWLTLAQHVLTHIHLNMWPITFHALLCLCQQYKGGNMSFMGS